MHQKHPNTLKIDLTKREKLIQKEILKTLLYSDLFSYPLTGDQVFEYLGMKVEGKELRNVLKTLPYIIVGRTIYYHLPKHQKFVDERVRKEKWNIQKIKKVKRIAAILSFIPTIRFIGISGSLALKNAEKNADSDLFFICAPHAVWFSRLLTYIVLELLGVKRKRNKKTSDGVCANMFMDERYVSFPKQKQNLYIAHEIAQIMPISDKRNYLQQLFLANSWVTKYFPNLLFPKRKRKNKTTLLWNILRPLEYILYNLQLWYMREHITRETTTQNIIAFHPIDYETMTLSLYNKRSSAYEI